MIVRFEFRLPEEQDDYEMYRHAREYYLALCDLYNALRNLWKYEQFETEEAQGLAARLQHLWADCTEGLEIP